MLGGVAHNGNEDQADEVLAYSTGRDDGVNAVDEILGAHGNHDRHGNENRRRGPGTHGRVLLVLFLRFLSSSGLGLRSVG